MPETAVIPWRRLLGEFLVIVVGVLVALAVDAWRGDQAEAQLARQHLQALLVDLTEDSMMLSRMDDGLVAKREALNSLRAVAWSDLPASPDSVARLLSPSAMYGWKMPEAQSAAYEELKNTGGLRLINDADLRSAIVGYYESWQHQIERLDRHRSDYPNLAYQMVPPDVFRADSALGHERDGLVEHFRTDRMREALNHEANYERVLAMQQQGFSQEAALLLDAVRDLLAR